MQRETIAAIATASGNAGVGIVRISGRDTQNIARKILGHVPTARYAEFTSFFGQDKEVIDRGIAIFFNAPHSFTGEDILELHAHGGSIVLDILLKETVICGARVARPGEFSERAFLNDKIDLLQAEAIADIISSRSVAAARSAVRSLNGEFSEHIHSLVKQLIALRVYVESAIDFPEEEIDFLADGQVTDNLRKIETAIERVCTNANHGRLLHDGITIVILGKPNAGKSSLLNSLAGTDAAIVNPQPGTTRDIIREDIHIDGIPMRIVDTAGLRDSEDPVEQEGIRRAQREIDQADAVLLVQDSTTDSASDSSQLLAKCMQTQSVTLPENATTIMVHNKIDLHDAIARAEKCGADWHVYLSANTRDGLPALQRVLLEVGGITNSTENTFVARRRHIDALQRALKHVHDGQQQLALHAAGELLAEDLLAAQRCLDEITGAFSSEDLLGEIFSSFCIGK